MGRAASRSSRMANPPIMDHATYGPRRTARQTLCNRRPWLCRINNQAPPAKGIAAPSSPRARLAPKHMTMPFRSRVVQPAAATALMIAVLTVGTWAANLNETKDYHSLIKAAMFLVGTGCGLTAVRQGRSLLFRNLDRQAAVMW